MLEADGNIVLLVMVVVAMIAALLYDLVTNVREPRPRREKNARAAITGAGRTPAGEVTVAPWVFGIDLATLRTPPPAVRESVEAVKQAAEVTRPAADVDPMEDLIRRLAALRQLGLDHVRDAHPLFQASTPSAAGLVRRPADATNTRPRRSRRGRRGALPVGVAAGRLRLAAHRGRVLPLH
jgi:hypothetical protein